MISPEERRFLEFLKSAGLPVTRKELPLATRKQDRIRQSCRNKGWAQWGKPVKNWPNGWHLTDEGRRQLQQGPTS